MNTYFTLAIVLLYALPNIIMPMCTKPITFDLINAIAEQQKAAEKALQDKNAGRIIPDYIIIKLHPNIQNMYFNYYQQLKSQRLQIG